MSKKSQIQMFETIVVLFIFFILIGIGMIFYARIHKSNTEIARYGLSESKSVIIAQRAMFMPELQCSEDNSIRENCIDLTKLEASMGVISSNELFYYDIFEQGEVNITSIYPDFQRWTIYSRKTEKPSSSLITNVPISLYDPITRSYRFGILTIETQTR